MKPNSKKVPYKLFWLGAYPAACNCCGLPIHSEFIDGATRKGPWFVLHPMCHRRIGLGLGVGRGQRYAKQSDGRWLKIEG